MFYIRYVLLIFSLSTFYCANAQLPTYIDDFIISDDTIPAFTKSQKPFSIDTSNWNTKIIFSNKLDIADFNDTIQIIFNNNEHFCIPVKGKFLSPFGKRGRSGFHSGVDIKLNYGDTVYAAFNGKVRYKKYTHGYGNVIILRHQQGLETVYSHLSKMLITENESVYAGQPIGLGGATGRATTSHLHFEIRFGGRAINPEKIINFSTNTLASDTIQISKYIFDYFSLPNAPTDSTIQTPVIYTVKKGDTLYSIAKKNNASVSQLCKINKITPKTILHIGDRIIINEF